MKKLIVLAVMAATLALNPAHTALSAPAVPTATQPANATRLDNFGPTLGWTVPDGTTVTQFHVRLVPANNDGPGIDLIQSSPNSWFSIPAPPEWYGLLPDLTYTWQVRVSDATTSVGVADPSWSDWSPARTFRTPLVSANTIGVVQPLANSTVSTLRPTLQWSENNPNVWYYEVQLSKDPGFGPSAFLYSELRHGGVTNPPRSYTVPPQFPLEAGTRYSWRVRPRVQGDGAPVAWSAAASFSTSGGAPGGEVPAQVTAVISGDTIEVLVAGARQQVKYLSIQAPGVAPAECYGAQAAALNSQLVEGQNVRLVRDVTDADPQGRMLRYVYIGDTFVNAELVRLGGAKVTFSETDNRLYRNLLVFQTTAQQNKAGLWGACSG